MSLVLALAFWVPARLGPRETLLTGQSGAHGPKLRS